MEWKNIIPEVNKKINDDGFGLFGIFFMMMLFKGLFARLVWLVPHPITISESIINPFTKRSKQDQWICFHHPVAHPLFHGDWLNCIGFTLLQSDEPSGS